MLTKTERAIIRAFMESSLSEKTCYMVCSYYTEKVSNGCVEKKSAFLKCHFSTLDVR